MMGCVGLAPPGKGSFAAIGNLGSFGATWTNNQIREGRDRCTCCVSSVARLLFVGDGQRGGGGRRALAS